MKYIIILLLLFKCSTSIGQTISVDSVFKIYDMDSVQLDMYCKNNNLPLKKEYIRNRGWLMCAVKTKEISFTRRFFIDTVSTIYPEGLMFNIINTDIDSIYKQLSDKGFIPHSAQTLHGPTEDYINEKFKIVGNKVVHILHALKDDKYTLYIDSK